LNDLQAYRGAFDGLEPWAGFVPEGYFADFLGVLTDARFQPLSGVDPRAIGNREQHTGFPVIGNGDNAEGWFEAVNWLAAARAARGRYVMITLGACFGAQAVGAQRTLERVNPMPSKLVAVEPVPENFAWMRQHMHTNGIDPDAHWLVPLSIGGSNDPVFFPVGGAGTGANNAFSTNEPGARRVYADTLIAAGRAKEALRELILNNTTGLSKNLVPGHDVQAEIKLVSCVTLHDLLGPFDLVDYLESDIQQSEILVFPPFVDLLRRKVRRIHIGTHGGDVHASLHALFADKGWEIVFSYAPNATHQSELGPFATNDGVLTVRNPDL
jgi:hypothetical protein